MSVLTIILGALATWRVAHILIYENGPFQIFRRIRIKSGVVYVTDTDEVFSYKYELFICLWCASVWVGLVTTLLMLLWPQIAPWIFMPFALSTLAILLDRIK